MFKLATLAAFASLSDQQACAGGAAIIDVTAKNAATFPEIFMSYSPSKCTLERQNWTLMFTEFSTCTVKEN
jgi:hypothetical protein